MEYNHVVGACMCLGLKGAQRRVLNNPFVKDNPLVSLVGLSNEKISCSRELF